MSPSSTICQSSLGAFYMMDKGYVDFARLFRLIDKWRSLSLVPKATWTLAPRVPVVDKSTGLRSDQTIVLTRSVDLAKLSRSLASHQLTTTPSTSGDCSF